MKNTGLLSVRESSEKKEMNCKPAFKLEYDYDPGVHRGTIRFISLCQSKDSIYLRYWPKNNFGQYYGPQYECGTACCCMALSYLGINVTPEVLLKRNSGTTLFERWGAEWYSCTPDFNPATEALFQKRLSLLTDGNGQYSPLMIHLKRGTWAKRGHYILVIAKKADGKYLALDPARPPGSALTELTIAGLSATESKVGAAVCPIDEIHQWFLPDNNARSDEEGFSGDITADSIFSGSGWENLHVLTDGHPEIFFSSAENSNIGIENRRGISGIYLLFDQEYGPYSITDEDTGKQKTAGLSDFLHEYLDMNFLFGRSPRRITLSFRHGPVSLSQIRVFGEGAVPDHIQRWAPPLEGCADIALFSAHGDDEQLFFSGLLPLYAKERNVAVQVVYLTDHRNLDRGRTHEMLNGLWAVGVRNYPVFGRFADFLENDLEDTYARYEEIGTTREELLAFTVTQIRRFRPKVAVGHDLNGEYGHGMHKLFADLLIKAAEISNSTAAFPESAAKYGTWDIPKLYLHLYDKNRIRMNYDVPLAAFDGLSAFEVTRRKGYPCHHSQQFSWFTKWLNGDDLPVKTADQIKTYNPCQFGLYRASSVPADVDANDMMENIVPYAKRS